MDYQAKLRQLYRRRNNITTHDFSYSADFLAQQSKSENKAMRYVISSMEEVEDNYRKNTMQAAEKVGNHLNEFNCMFKLQGSVTTQTEIVKGSDADLVVITNRAVSLEQGLPNPSPYQGNLAQDLKELRYNCEMKLQSVYNEVNVGGSKSIEVYLTNPKRKVDVVVANWHEFRQYTSDEYEKGICLYDKNKNQRLEADYPFLRAHRINCHSYQDKIKNMVRFMKNFREDFEIQNLTSFQINCIAYNLSYSYYSYNKEIYWLKELQSYLPKQGYYKEIDSPCGKEKVRVEHNIKFAQALDQLIEDASYTSYENLIL